MSSLDAAYVRVARGREHLAQLKEVSDEVCDWYADQLSKIYPGRFSSGDDLLTALDGKHPEPRIPPKASILIGEAVYNYRAALDYLVCALSKADGPTLGKRRNQFPIESTRQGFAARRHTFLAGLRDAHVTAIQHYQPFEGCSWTGQLARLSNLDKHNDLIIVAQGMQIELKGEDHSDTIQCVISLHLTLAGGKSKPVTGVLERLGREVSLVLDRFR